jgi:hypothetical protein
MFSPPSLFGDQERRSFSPVPMIPTRLIDRPTIESPVMAPEP